MGVSNKTAKKAATEKNDSAVDSTARSKAAWGVSDEDIQQVSTNRGSGGKRRKRRLAQGHPFAHVSGVERWLVGKMLELAGNPPVNIMLWDKQCAGAETQQPVGSLQFHDRSALLKLIMDPELHFGDLYSSGRVGFDGDLVRFLEEVYRRLRQAGKDSLLRRLFVWLGHRRIANSPSTARDNIHHHYDIGNDFYRLWLDKDVMQYTCAYFPNPEMTLEAAQVAKLHHVCRKLQLKPGDTVVEAGCGWGGLARFMAKHYGVTVKAYNISHQQVIYAREQALKEGLADKVEYIEDDYRNISARFDVFVSVGMLEHVGVRDYPVLGRVIDNCLKADGRGLIHTIGRNQPGPMNAWIERRIFPGAYPPTLKEMMEIFQPYAFAVQDVENLRLHYAKTLQHWLARFDEHEAEIIRMMDEEFVRAWRLYLAGSIAAFTTSELELFQVAFSRAGHNALPWSRAYLYTDEH